MRAGLTGGSPTDTLDTNRALTTIDFGRTFPLFDTLVRFNKDAQIENSLAQSLEPNSDATVWTVKLKPGISFHNGKPLSADDVLFTFNRVVDNQYNSVTALSRLDLKKARKVDELTLELPCHGPYSILDQVLASNFYTLGIVPSGFDPQKPIGTGPFKFASFTPGQESVYDANTGYWDKAPHIEKLIITNFQDETAQLNALQSGQVDVINQLSVASIDLAKVFGQVLVSPGGAITPLVMRCDKAPFDDVRVRHALRLVIDRPKMNDIVFGGNATIGNDVFSPFDPNFDKSLPQRQQDIAKAKALLAEAGKSDLTIELVVADISFGVVQTAQVFARQASEAGITVKINKVTVAEIFGSNYLNWDFSMDTWYYVGYLAMAGYATVKGASFGQTHFQNDKYNDLFNEALATVDPEKRKDIVHQMQKIDYEEGGYIIPYFPCSIDAFSNKVHGIQPSKTGVSFGNFDFRSMWIA
ncbi:ABC transporter substrate-binding protein (plasmid) [Mesorhizobium sp. ORM8.1]